MKNLNLIVILLILSTASASAQKFGGGIYLGGNTSQVGGDDMAGFNKIGLYGGVFVNWELKRNNFIQFELSYIQKGSRERSDKDNPNPFLYTIKTDYLEMPLLFKWEQDPFVFEIGIAASYLVFGDDLDGINTFDPTAEFEKTNLCLIIGTAYPLTDRLYLSTRLSNSIIPFRKQDNPNPYLFLRGGQFHTGLAFTFQYYFND